MKVHEGDTLRVGGKVVLRKTCGCAGSSSGPCMIEVAETRTDALVTSKFVLVALACDECRTPWEAPE